MNRHNSTKYRIQKVTKYICQKQLTAHNKPSCLSQKEKTNKQTKLSYFIIVSSSSSSFFKRLFHLRRKINKRGGRKTSTQDKKVREKPFN